MKMETKLIYKTKDYHLFNLIKVNRDVKPNDAPSKRLYQSMKKHGYNSALPIVVRKTPNSVYDVIDGQHRLYFAQKLNIEVWFTFDETNMDISEHNESGKNWTISDHILRWYKEGLESYIEIVEFSEKYKLNLATSAGLLAGTTTVNNVKTKITTGNYTVQTRDLAVSVAKCVNTITKESDISNRNACLHAIYALHFVDYFEPDDLIEKVRINPGLLVNYGDRDGFLEMFDEIYNYRRRSKVPLSFDAIKAMKERNATNN